MRKVLFWINRFDAQKTARIMAVVFRKKPYIKVTVEDNNCILLCHDLGDDPVGYVCEYLVQNKKFMGKFHYSMQTSHKFEIMQDRLQVPVCRFGWFDLCLLENLSEFNHWKIRFDNLRSGMTLHEADMDADLRSGHKFAVEDRHKKHLYDGYVADLVTQRGLTEEQAHSILEPLYTGWRNMTVKVVEPEITVEQRNECMAKSVREIENLIFKLQFMSAKKRKIYLNETVVDSIKIRILIKINGSEWMLKQVGEIPGYTDI